METDDSMLEQVLGLCDSFAALTRSLVDAASRVDLDDAVTGMLALQASGESREPA